jgi:hypothetical protein
VLDYWFPFIQHSINPPIQTIDPLLQQSITPVLMIRNRFKEFLLVNRHGADFADNDAGGVVG